jgi:hypothetical protein
MKNIEPEMKRTAKINSLNNPAAANAYLQQAQQKFAKN